jgi:hypothetical protein
MQRLAAPLQVRQAVNPRCAHLSICGPHADGQVRQQLALAVGRRQADGRTQRRRACRRGQSPGGAVLAGGQRRGVRRRLRACHRRQLLQLLLRAQLLLDFQVLQEEGGVCSGTCFRQQ